MMRITGRPLSPEPFLTYLETKFGSLYRFAEDIEPQTRR